MSIQTAHKFVKDDVYDFMDKYYGHRINLTCKDGVILSAKLDWFYEGEDELGIMLEDVTKGNGEHISGISLPLSAIDTFTSLEGENTPEEIDRMFA
jgi:hypothetical protein